jgi:hypothetical protein
MLAVTCRRRSRLGEIADLGPREQLMLHIDRPAIERIRGDLAGADLIEPGQGASIGDIAEHVLMADIGLTRLQLLDLGLGGLTDR